MGLHSQKSTGTFQPVITKRAETSPYTGPFQPVPSHALHTGRWPGGDSTRTYKRCIQPSLIRHISTCTNSGLITARSTVLFQYIHIIDTPTLHYVTHAHCKRIEGGRGQIVHAGVLIQHYTILLLLYCTCKRVRTKQWRPRQERYKNYVNFKTHTNTCTNEN